MLSIKASNPLAFKFHGFLYLASEDLKIRLVMRNKSTKRYSYTGHDSRESKFINKNLNKTTSYNTNFSGAIFENTAFVGAKFKFCSFYGAKFFNCYFRGALFRGVNLQNCTFKECIISSSVFDRCKFNRINFVECKIVSSGKLQELLPESCFEDTEILSTYPSIDEFDPELINSVEAIRLNDFIRRSSVLHRKRKQIDTVSLKVLVEEFGDEFLLQTLKDLPYFIVKDFYTLSYIMHFLRKMQGCDKNDTPGPAALGTPKPNV